MHRYQKNKFEQTYQKCEAVFEVIVPGSKRHEESEKYFCPECLCMHKVRASNTPNVRLISSRTDKCANPYEE